MYLIHDYLLIFTKKKNFAYTEYNYYVYRVNTSSDENEIEECQKICDLYLCEYQTYVALETEALSITCIPTQTNLTR